MANRSAPIVIVGAGATGIACALTAAAQGEEVVLLESSTEIGGTVAHSLIHTLGGLFDDQGEIINPGITEELIERLIVFCPETAKRRIGKTWTLSVDPAVYLAVVKQWLEEQPRIQVHRQVTITEVSTEERRVDLVHFHAAGLERSLRPSVLIDASGQAAIVRRLSSTHLTEGAALAGWIVQLRGVAAHALAFPNGVALLHTIRTAVKAGTLPTECGSIWLDRGVMADEAYVKFNLEPQRFDLSHMTSVMHQLLAYLQALPSFAGASIQAVGQLGIRDGGRIEGEYVLTEADVREGRCFADAVCHACWPIEYWHPQNGVSLHYFPPGHRYQIPKRALTVRGYSHLYVVGKCFSAEPMALASARVAGTCWAMGEGLLNQLSGES